MENEKLISLEEAAKLYRVSVRTIHHWIAQGAIAVQKRDGRTMLSDQKLRDALCQTPASPQLCYEVT